MIIDVAFLIVMIIAVFQGYSKGFIVGIFSFIGFLIGLAAALKLSAIVAHRLEFSADISTKWLPVVSFALVFILVVFLVNIGARILKKAVSMVMLGWVDKIGRHYSLYGYLQHYFQCFTFFWNENFDTKTRNNRNFVRLQFRIAVGA